MKKEKQSNIISYKLEVNFCPLEYTNYGFKEYQRSWIHYLFIKQHFIFRNYREVDYQLELLELMAEKLNLDQNLLIKVAINNDITDLSVINQQHIDYSISLENNIAVVAKDYFLGDTSAPIVWRSKTEMKQEKSKQVIKDFLDDLMENNPEKFDLCAKEIARLGVWLVENKNFVFNNVAHFAATANKLINTVKKSSKTPAEIVDYNIQHNKSFGKIADVGELK